MMIDSETDGPPVEAPGFLRRAVARVSSAINLVALAVLALMSLLIVADVIGRYCFLRPITRSYEMVGLLTLIVVGLGLPYATMRLGHLKVGWVLSRFPSRAQSVISGIWDVLGLGVFSLITWQSVMLAEGLRPEAAAAAVPAGTAAAAVRRRGPV